ncbi:MAG TPA: hypothetical protein PLK55_00290 [archaeon]|nr:hypothetical protein [archaeon]
MIKTKKGQVMLLDVLFAVVIVILMFFLLLKFVETDIYKTNVDSRTEELTSIGSIAYQKFLNNPKINCKVTDSQNSFYLPGTIDTSETITKADLGIPADYNCHTDPTVDGCQATAFSGPSYTIQFPVVTCSTDLNKNTYIDYITDIYNPSTQLITLQVWRAS